MILGLHHVSLPVHDLSKACYFYTEILQFKEKYRPQLLPGNGSWLQAYGMEIHLIEDQHYSGPGLGDAILPQKKHFAFKVNDIDDFWQFLVNNNVTVSNPHPLDTNFRQFHFLDPSDNPIEVTDYIN